MTVILVGGHAEASPRAPDQLRGKDRPFSVYEAFAAELLRLLKSRNASFFHGKQPRFKIRMFK
jgi:hypothetical protein